jgi:hypothetical protein
VTRGECPARSENQDDDDRENRSGKHPFLLFRASL